MCWELLPRCWLGSRLRSEANWRDGSCLSLGAGRQRLRQDLVELSLLALGTRTFEFERGFVVFALDRCLVAKDELQTRAFGRVDEEIGEGNVWVGMRVLIAVCFDTIAVKGVLDAYEALQSPGCGDYAIGGVSSMMD